MRILRAIRFLLVLPLLALTLAFSPKAGESDALRLTGQKAFVFDQAFVMGQGVTTDGEYYYTSGAITALDMTGLAKFTFPDMTPVTHKINPLPEVCVKRGNNHIGGVSCYNGRIYASVEGGDVCCACVVTFRCEDLSFAGEVYDLPGDLFPDGVPWLAVDGATGLLYASPWSHAANVYVFDVNDGMRLVREIPVQGLGELDRIQGGEFYEGVLYLSRDVKDAGDVKQVLRFDPATGLAEVCAVREIGDVTRCETEGMTVCPAPDGSLFHVLDYNKRIGVFVRHYAWK